MGTLAPMGTHTLAARRMQLEPWAPLKAPELPLFMTPQARREGGQALLAWLGRVRPAYDKGPENGEVGGRRRGGEAACRASRGIQGLIQGGGAEGSVGSQARRGCPG